MSRQVVPLQPVPSQSVQVQLSDQAVILDVYQLTYGLFINVWVGNSLIVCGVICQNLNRIVRSAYLGFVGDLAFVDVQSEVGEETDPVYTGLGSRYQLMYFPEDTLANDTAAGSDG